jgi:LmbE family N-acetylglucosaminyl deacetylase
MMWRVAGLRVVAIVAHPDDETLGCGATLARLARLGARCRVVLVFRRTDPRGGSHWDSLVRNFAAACEILGCEPVVDARRPGTGDGLDRQALHDALVDEVDHADVVLTHWEGDTHQAHQALAHVVEIATRPFRRRRDVLQFEVPSASDQGFRTAFLPNLCVPLDRSDVAAQERAMACYPTEFAPGRSPGDLVAHAAYRGRQFGLEFAQVFRLSRATWWIGEPDRAEPKVVS